jgi:hypothetical protein
MLTSNWRVEFVDTASLTGEDQEIAHPTGAPLRAASRSFNSPNFWSFEGPGA